MFNQYNENITDKMTPKDVKLSEIDEENKEIKVYTKTINYLGNKVGDGIDELSFHFHVNEVTFKCVEHAWGGIRLHEWNELDEVLNSFKNKEGFYDYLINPSHNEVTLFFDTDGYEIGEY